MSNTPQLGQQRSAGLKRQHVVPYSPPKNIKTTALSGPASSHGRSQTYATAGRKSPRKNNQGSKPRVTPKGQLKARPGHVPSATMSAQSNIRDLQRTKNELRDVIWKVRTALSLRA